MGREVLWFRSNLEIQLLHRGADLLVNHILHSNYIETAFVSWLVDIFYYYALFRRQS